MPRSLVVLALAAAACGHSAQGPSESDCRDVLDDPAHAVARLSTKYPQQAVKVATIVEDCVAPTGTPCERVAALAAKIPTMMSGAPALTDPLKTCQESPPALQRCLLPSYVLAHADECKNALHEQSQVTSIDIKPGPPPPADPGPPCADAHVYIEQDHLAYGRDHRIDLHARKDDIMNFSGLESGLKRLATECRGVLLVHATPTVMYQDMISVMDIAHKVGLSEIQVDTGSDAQMPPALPTSMSGTDNVAKAPVLVVTATDLTLDGQVIAHTKDKDVTAAVHDALAAKVPGVASPLVILQATAGTSARIVNQVVNAARSLGFNNVMFAVKQQ
jgi:biopolymer transport protein ExbD